MKKNQTTNSAYAYPTLLRKIAFLFMTTCLLTTSALGMGLKPIKSNYSIKFPKDTTITCTLPLPNNVETFTKKNGTDILVIEIDDQQMPTLQPNACFEIHRTFRVKDISDWNGINAPTIVGRDEDCDGWPGDEDIWVNVRPQGKDGETAYLDQDGDETNNVPKQNTKPLDCDGTTNPKGYWKNIPSNAYWQYTQILTVYDDIQAPVILTEINAPFCSFDNVNCTAPIDVYFSVLEKCPSETISITIAWDASSDGDIDAVLDNGDVLSGTYPDYGISGSYPIGDHIFVVTVTNECGKSTEATIPFSVGDCKAPAPICANMLNISLAPVIPPADVDGDGDSDYASAFVTALDFVAVPVSDCSPPVSYSINRIGETPDVNQTGLMITCNDLPVVTLEIHAWDAVGNSDFCVTSLYVQDNFAFCAFPPEVTYEETEPFCSYNNATCDAPVNVPFQVGASGCEASEQVIIDLSFDAYADGIIDEILDEGVVLNSSGSDFIIGGNYPIGEHFFVLEVMNACGLSTVVEIPFSVVDCKAPAVICVNGLSLVLMPVVPPEDINGDGTIDYAKAEVSTGDLLAATFPDCSEPVTYSINRNGEIPDMSQSTLLLTCDDPSIVIVDIYAWDAAGHNDYCQTFVMLEDNLALCSSGSARILENRNDHRTPGEFRLFQNIPNPFFQETSIGFYLPEAGEITLKIWDITGRIHKYLRGDFAAGHNSIPVFRTDFPVTGMLFYTVSNGQFTTTRKMILMD